MPGLEIPRCGGIFGSEDELPDFVCPFTQRKVDELRNTRSQISFTMRYVRFVQKVCNVAAAIAAADCSSSSNHQPVTAIARERFDETDHLLHSYALLPAAQPILRPTGGIAHAVLAVSLSLISKSRSLEITADQSTASKLLASLGDKQIAGKNSMRPLNSDVVKEFTKCRLNLGYSASSIRFIHFSHGDGAAACSFLSSRPFHIS